MEPWHVEGTRALIRRVYGQTQLDLAAPSLRSLYDRDFYSRFHFGRAKDTLNRYVRRRLRDKDFALIAFGVDEPEWNRFNVEIRKIAADYVACIQSLHAIPDILASAVYYSLALNEHHPVERGRYVNHRFVVGVLSELPELATVQATLKSVVTGSHFEHLAALSNRSKHTSIVFPSLSCDRTGERPEQYMVCFPEFQDGDKPLRQQVYANEFLAAAHTDISKAKIETGKAVHAVLQGRLGNQQ